MVCQGSMMIAPLASKCRVLRVKTRRPCRRAVAAKRPSTLGMMIPDFWARAVSSPHSRAVSSNGTENRRKGLRISQRQIR